MTKEKQVATAETPASADANKGKPKGKVKEEEELVCQLKQLSMNFNTLYYKSEEDLQLKTDLENSVQQICLVSLHLFHSLY
jgi:hypothetical protein